MSELEKIQEILHLNQLIAEMEKNYSLGKNLGVNSRDLLREARKKRNSIFNSIDKEAPYIHTLVQEAEFERRTSYYYMENGFGTLLFYVHERLWYESLGGKKKIAIPSGKEL